MATKKKATKKKVAKKKTTKKKTAHRRGNRPGRPGGPNKDSSDKIAQGVADGLFLEQAMALVGRHKHTYHLWRKLGDAALQKLEEGQKLDARESEYAYFRAQTREAEVACELEHLAVVKLSAFGYEEVTEEEAETLDGDGNVAKLKKTRKAGKFNSADARWFLERRFPGQWGNLGGETEVKVEDYGKSITVIRGPAPKPEAK